MPVVFNSTMKTPMSSEHRSLTRSRQDESFAKIVDNLLTEGNRRLINRNDQDVFCSLDRELHKKCQLEIEFENNLLRLYREKNIIIKNRNAREKEVQRKKESAMEAASNQEKVTLEQVLKVLRKEFSQKIFEKQTESSS
ncbi:hypothetical protein ECG_05347 [Echinococcus granulosus]|nr:hypothetical protein ECG_05347 [Echinococcus granulosus]